MVRMRAVALFVGVALIVAACGDDAGDTGAGAEEPPTDSTAQPEEADDSGDGGAADQEAAERDMSGDLRVVATLAPLADVVERVLGDRGVVDTLVPTGMDTHSYEPRPGDVAPLADADIFFGNGLALNPAAVALAEANLPDDAPLVLLAEETLSADALNSEHWHTHDDDSHTHDEPAADGGDANPHVWTAVPNVQAFVEGIAAALADVDPDGAAGYEERAGAYLAELEALHAAIRTGVDSIPEDARRLVVYHDAWTYFGDTYGVEVVAAVQPSDFSEPSAGDVRAIVDQLRAEGVPAIFGSEEFPNDVIAVITDETGAQYVGDLSDDILPGDPGDPDHSYVGMMRTNAAKIVEALGGDPAPLHELSR